MKILITGGTGFIGSHLARHLLTKNKNDIIIIVDDASMGHQRPSIADILDKCEWHKISLLNKSSWESLPKVDQIYHLAGVLNTRHLVRDKATIVKDNFLMMAHLLNWRGDAKIVFTSTSEVYHGNGNINLPVREDYPILFPYIDDRWSYAYAKYGCEQMLTGDYVIARLCNTYGPDMCHNYVVKAQIQRILNGEDITVINPDDTRPFTYVSDIVSGLVHLMNTDMESQVYNLGSPISYTIMNMTERLVAMTGDQVKVERGPQGALEQRGPSIRKLFEETGWQPKVGLTEGLQQTWERYYGNNSSN